ncbi:MULTISPECIES: hypothetical protein [unclassified Streptomyces]|uniref:hypothetical protein n=1 Tax=unclassified Streptomyces TaxID=2593676 RepID=UPI000DC76A28|nr:MULTISPECIES: hypothetical protein [unclassified Streptomyces]AWZ09071.1 hypothetical protein DRB89_36290 [Streptomyces sp. ICC4]AWZ15932.1 hypothetical protein DRB96_30900 [Streptomyces sp. ICC1]
MIELGVFFGAMGLAALWMIRTLLRRGNRSTETADGLRIEQAGRELASAARVSYSSTAVHGSLTQSHTYRP